MNETFIFASALLGTETNPGQGRSVISKISDKGGGVFTKI